MGADEYPDIGPLGRIGLVPPLEFILYVLLVGAVVALALMSWRILRNKFNSLQAAALRKSDAVEGAASVVRPESGPMQFPDDWPGVFIRGDEAMIMAHTIELITDDPTAAPFYRFRLRGLAALLRSCDADFKPECQHAALTARKARSEELRTKQ